MECSYKFRVYPNKEQEKLIQATFGCCRFVYNYYLTKRKEIYEQTRATFNYYDCSRNLTSLKCELEWLRKVDARALISSLKDLDSAYQNFFRRVKKGEISGYPQFKSKTKSNASRYAFNKWSCSSDYFRIWRESVANL